MLMIYTYNASYGIYQVRDAISLNILTSTVFEDEARIICESGIVPTEYQYIH